MSFMLVSIPEGPIKSCHAPSLLVDISAFQFPKDQLKVLVAKLLVAKLLGFNSRRTN